MNRVIIACVFLCSARAVAGTWYVAPTGADTAAGTTAAPFRTIQHAADVATAGDTVHVAAGTYVGFQVGARGTAASPIAFVADGAVMIDGAHTTDRDAIHIENASYIRVEGFTVTGATRAGISALACDHITIRGNHSDRNGEWGIFSGFCDDLTIENNVASRSTTQHGIYASNASSRPVIRGNEVFGNAMCGIQMNGDISQGGDGLVHDALVENNYVHDNGASGGSAINCDGVVGATIRNNVLDNNHASGISLYQIDGGAPSTGNVVVFNTVRMANDARWAVNIQNASAGNTVRDNILLDGNPATGAIDACAACTTGMSADFNIVDGRFAIDDTAIDLATWRARTGNDASSAVATASALFANPATGDLSLAAASPAIDHGDAQDAPAADFAGTARPQHGAYDIGAYEYCFGSCDAGGGSGTGSDTGGGGGSGSDSGGNGAHHAGCAAGGGGGPCVIVAIAALVLRRRRGGSR